MNTVSYGKREEILTATEPRPTECSVCHTPMRAYEVADHERTCAIIEDPPEVTVPQYVMTEEDLPPKPRRGRPDDDGDGDIRVPVLV